MKIQKIILMMINCALLGLYFDKVNKIKILNQQMEEVEKHFLIYRSAAQDAFGWAIGCNSGEQIPNEFFERYLDDNLTQEEFERKYEEAKEIVGEKLKIQRKRC